MNIIGTSYTLQHKSFDLYISGCSGNPHCEGCHNPESWNFDQGKKYNQNYFTKIKSKILDFNDLIENIMIFGGEPLDNNHNELIELLEDLTSLNKSVWLFTRYDFEEIPMDIKSLCDYIKCGKYNKEMITENNVQFGIKLATANQKIYKIGGNK
jgi:anaerobic ribonucleoside-triphosphate reductase activating protein